MGKLRKFIASASMVAILSSLVVTQAVFAAFSDVGADHWASAAVAWGVDNECIDDSKATFEVDKGANRAETAKLGVCLADLEGDGTLGSAVFSDSVAGAWYDTYLGIAYNNGVFTGDTGTDPLTVRPGAELNRAEAAKVILKAFDLPVLDGQNGADKFSDVKSTDWFDSYLGASYCYEDAEGTKILGGFPDGTAHPGDAVTKGAIVKMAYVAQNAVVGDDCSGATPVEGDDDDAAADDDAADDDAADDDAADDDDAPAPTASGLTVTVNDDTPATGELPSGATGVEMVTWDFTASDDGDVTLGSLVVDRYSVTDLNTAAKVYLYEGSERLTSGKNINSD
ncbi:MAG: S-layer homology domain-containing protein, partial [bacterium]|nr:S-layer homology domain-containing protein [bacterium]